MHIRSNFSLGNYTTNLSGQWDENGNATELILQEILFLKNKL
jgi:hypothetical protein